MKEGARIAWVGGYPAHYTRVFHCAIERSYPDVVSFVYVGGFERYRSYERGDLPHNAHFLDKCANWITVARKLNDLSPRAILVSGHYPRPLLYGAIWGFLRQCPVMYWADTNIHDVMRKSVWLRLLGKIFFVGFFGRMFALLYPGSSTREFYMWATGRSSASKMIRMPIPILPVDLRQFAESADVTKKTCRVLYLGRLSPEKAVDRLIQAFNILAADVRARTRLIIAGDGPEKERLSQLAMDLRLADSVEFRGEVASDHVDELYGNASFLVLPSSQDAWGLVVAEALARGLPVIVPFWVGAVADLVIDGVTGLVVRDNSPEEIARAITALVNDPARVRYMGDNGRNLVADGSWGLRGALAGLDEVLTRLGVDS